MDDRPIVGSWVRRLRGYLRHNRARLVVDVTVLLTWIVVSTALFRWLALPQWLHYLVFFVGIVVYSAVTPAWERPYRSA